MKRILLFALVCSWPAFGQNASIQYLGNEGVMVMADDTKVLFDPLFDNGFGQYQLVPDTIRDGIFAGTPPYDDVDAVFVSHHHGDHFSAADMLRLLRERPEVKLYAPAQAVTAIRGIAGNDDQAALERMTGLDLDYGDQPVVIEAPGLIIEAAHVPHAGWPTARTDVQNIAFRVTLEDNNTVLHMGDADPRTVHFESDEEFWEERVIDIALPPYWYFSSSDGVEILEDRMNIMHAIGIHVPTEYADSSKVPAALRGRDLFTDPGEGRRF